METRSVGRCLVNQPNIYNFLQMASSENYNNEDLDDIAAKDFQIATGNVGKNSYNIGITDGKETAAQIGFDQGYVDGLVTSLTISKIRAFVEILKNSSEENSNIENLNKRLFDEIKTVESRWPGKASTFEDCTILEQLDDSVKNITELQREQMRIIEKDLIKLFPTISSYLLNNDCNKIKNEI